MVRRRGRVRARESRRIEHAGLYQQYVEDALCGAEEGEGQGKRVKEN